MGIQGFLKGFSGVPGPGAGRLTSSGLDLRVLREGPNVTAWLGYSLAWFWYGNTQVGSSTGEFTGRHLLTAGLTGGVAGPIGVDLRVSFSDGLPYTSVDFASDAALEAPGRGTSLSNSGEATSGGPALAGGPADGFLRLDAEIHADLVPVWGGRSFALRPYLKVLNALARRDALFWYFAPWRDPEVQPLADLSLVPVVGLEWRF